MGRSCPIRSEAPRSPRVAPSRPRVLRPRDCATRLQPGSQSPSDDPERHRRLHPHMAKKRVHELAKQYDMPSAEVLKRLAAAGIEVKASASAGERDAGDPAPPGRPQKAEEDAQRAAAAARSANGAGQTEGDAASNG